MARPGALPSLHIAAEAATLSAAQKKFNHQLKRIDRQRQLLAQWQAASLSYRERYAREISPLQAGYEQEMAALVELLEQASGGKLSKTESATL
jgi:hypothetical protein